MLPNNLELACLARFSSNITVVDLKWKLIVEKIVYSNAHYSGHFWLLWQCRLGIALWIVFWHISEFNTKSTYSLTERLMDSNEKECVKTWVSVKTSEKAADWNYELACLNSHFSMDAFNKGTNSWSFAGMMKRHTLGFFISLQCTLSLEWVHAFSDTNASAVILNQWVTTQKLFAGLFWQTQEQQGKNNAKSKCQHGQKPYTKQHKVKTIWSKTVSWQIVLCFFSLEIGMNLYNVFLFFLQICTKCVKYLS